MIRYKVVKFDCSYCVFRMNHILMTSITLNIVMILACVTRTMLRKEMLDHLDDVEQYYR